MHEGTVSRRSVLCAVAGLLATTVVAWAEIFRRDAADAPAGVARHSRSIRGWQVFVSRTLLAAEPRAGLRPDGGTSLRQRGDPRAVASDAQEARSASDGYPGGFG